MTAAAKIIAIACVAVVACTGMAHAATIEAEIDQFYGGLGAVIENNIDDPDQCLAAVDEYFRQNQATVRKIREQTQKAMGQVMGMMDEYQSKYAQMSAAELDALEREAEQREAQYEAQMSPGMKRYNEAMQEFTMRYPRRGMELAGKLMQIMPGFQQ